MALYRHGAVPLAGMLGMTLLLFAGSVRALPAAEGEVRDFQVKVNNKPAGEYHLTISQQEDGSTAVSADARITVSYLVYRYKYQYQGTENWRGDRLMQLRSTANDNGTRYAVTAAAQGDRLRVQVNNGEHDTRADVWTTTYWRLPHPRYRNQEVPLLDVDTGQDLKGNLRFVEARPATIAGMTLECTHYRLTGDRPKAAPLSVELWYDPQGRLVWQDTLEEGRHVVLEITRISR